MAPVAPDANDSASAGPRVAPRDHERGWESALRAPFRVAFYPLHLFSNGLEGGIGVLGPRFLDPKAPRPPHVGPVFGPALSVGAVDDIGIGPALSWNGFGAAKARLQLSGTLSAIDHRRARASLTFPASPAVGVRLRASYNDKPNERYFGIGNSSQVFHSGYFRLATTEVDGTVLLGSAPRRQLRLAGGYSEMNPGKGSHGTPLIENVFTPAEVSFELASARELWYGVGGDLAALDDARNPSRGAHGRFDLRRASGIRAGDPSWLRWNLEARGYLPVFAKRRVVALRAVYAGYDPDRGSSAELPFYQLAQSEDASRFAGYSSGRFRDLQLVHARVEYRWEVFHGASAVALYDVGEVQPRAVLFRASDVHPSYGGGLRMGVSDTATLRAELAKSVEGYHASLMLGGDF